MKKEMAALLERANRQDQSAREQLVVENSGLIWSIVRRYAGKGIETDDLYQLGCIGFLKAIDGFDAGFGTEFSTYAVPKIAGEIRRFIRDDGAIKVSRGMKEQAASIKAEREKLTGVLSREPTLTELSEAIGMTVQEIAAVETATAHTESIQRESGEEGFSLEQVLTDGFTEEQLIEKIAMREAVMRLPERERIVIDLRYYRGLTQEKSAKIMKVSQVQVSRMEKKALEHLRRHFEMGDDKRAQTV